MAGEYGWAVSSGGVLYPTGTINFTRQVDSLDSAIVVLKTKLAINAVASIMFNNQAIMGGVVKSCTMKSQKTYSILIAEVALDLKTQLACASTGSSNILVDNTLGTKTVHDYVLAILGTVGQPYASGYTDGTNSAVAIIPNSSPAAPFPSMKFTSMYRMAALDKFLKNTCGYMYWFDYTTRTVYYGEYRVDRTASDLQAIDVKQMENSAISEYTQVKVFGKNTTIIGVASSGSAPYKTIQYQYMDYADTNELTRIAEQILRDKAPQGLRYEVEMTIQHAIALSLAPGDKVTVTWPVEAISDTGVIRDINYSGDTAVLGVGDREVSAFDLLDDKLRLIQGVTSVGSTYAWDGGWQNIGPAATAKWQIWLDDADQIGSFNLHVPIDKFKKFMSVDQAMSGLDTTNSGYTGFTGDNTKEIGISNTNNAMSGLTTSNSAYTNLTGVALLNRISSYYSRTASGSSVAISSVGFTDVTGSQTINALAAGIHFGIAFLNLEIQDTSGTGSSGYTAKLWQDNVGWVSDAVLAYAYNISSTGYYNLSFSVIFLGDTYPYGTAYRWYVQANYPGCTALHWFSEIQAIPRHDHGITDITHANGITDKNQQHGLTDPRHFHSITDITHPHNITDENHDHNENDNLTETAMSTPSTIIISVNGTIVSTVVSSTVETIECGDIKALLIDGENLITITSTGTRAAFPIGELTVYGDVT